MAVTSVLKNILSHLKKTYLIFLGALIVLGVLLFIPGIKNNTTLPSIIHSIFLVGSCVFSFILGSVMIGQYGKTYAIIQNNKLPLMIVSLLFAIGNAVIFSLVLILYRSSLIFSFAFILFAFIIFFTLFYLGALYSMFVKEKNYIIAIIVAILLFASFCFARQISVFINIIKIMYNEGNVSILYTIIISIIGLCSFLGTNYCYYVLDAKKIYFKK